MISIRLRITLSGVVLASVLSACAASATPLPADAPTPTPVPSTATEVSLPTATQPGPSFEPDAYRDEVAGYEFDHPASWFVGPVQQYSRGGVTAFTSWERPTDVLPGEAPPGETRLDATVQLWDPKGDLEAFVAQRMTAWDASGIGILSQEEWTLRDGRAARAFIVAGSDGAQGYLFFTTLGDDYLVLSGSGDLTLLAEIAHTVRPLTTP